MYLNKKNLAAAYFPASKAVSSALESLTSVFGMGTGISSPLWPPGLFPCIFPDFSSSLTGAPHPFLKSEDALFYAESIIWSSLSAY